MVGWLGAGSGGVTGAGGVSVGGGGAGVIGNFAPPRKCPPRQFSLVNTVPQALFSSEYCPPGALFT